jgi:hypothetical protein
MQREHSTVIETLGDELDQRGGHVAQSEIGSDGPSRTPSKTSLQATKR